MNPLVIILAVISTLFGGYGAMLFKRSSTTIKLDVKALLQNKNLLGGIVCYGLATLIFLTAYRLERLSLVYPLVSMSYVWVALFSALILKEKIRIMTWIGFACIILGIVIMHIT
jgi:uncharacterized membrane protein